MSVDDHPDFILCHSTIDDSYSNAVAMNETEFIVCPDNRVTEQDFNVLCYDTTDPNKKWKDIFRMEKTSRDKRTFSSYNSIAFDKHKQRIYVLNSDSIVIMILLQSKSFIQQQANKKYDTKYCSSLFINGHLHVIGGTNHRKHIIWTKNGALYKFKKRHKFSKFKEFYRNHGVVQIESKQMVLLMGGEDADGPVDDIVVYQYDKDKWLRPKLKLPKPLSSFGCVVTMNEKYVIIIGGLKSNEIFILNLEKMEFSNCRLKLPHTGGCHCVLLQNQRSNFLVYGYVRLLCRFFKFEYPSMDILDVMSSCYSDQFIHILNREIVDRKERNYYGEAFHYKVALNKILEDENALRQEEEDDFKKFLFYNQFIGHSTEL